MPSRFYSQLLSMARFLLFLILCILGKAEGYNEGSCEWESNIEERQRLDPESWNVGATVVARRPDLTDADACRAACCEFADCQLALVGFPADGNPECILINCTKDGKDVCILRKSIQFTAYRRRQVSIDQEPQRPKVAQLDGRANNTQEYCHYPSVVGPCRAAFPRFYYDVTTQSCKLFIYGGCQGNENNFNSQEECDSACSGVTGDLINPQGAPKRRMVEPEDDKDVSSPEVTEQDLGEKCHAPPEVGRCRAAMPRFYHNGGRCHSFIYGGCGGNKNNYLTEEECMNTCSGKFPEHGHHAEMPHWSPGFFLVGTLSIICVVLLVGLLLIAARRAKHQRTLILDDKQELLPEEHLPVEEPIKTVISA